MTETLLTAEDWRNARMLDPHAVEYPCTCLRCHETFSVFRALDAGREIVLGAAIVIHHETSPACRLTAIQIGEPIPFGPPADTPQEDHDDR
jgi:hypothetical protein